MDFRTGKTHSDIPLVTVAVSSYNYSMYIQAALDSVLIQTYRNIELLIIDDCSSDSCPQIIANWIETNKLHCTFIQHEKNQGITKTSNEFVRLAKGKYISLFATDDIMLPEKIEQQVKELEAAGDEYGVCYANVKLMNEAGKDIGLYDKEFKVFTGDVLEDFVFQKFQFCTPSTVIRMDVYQKAGLYDERMLLEDYDFWLRVLALFKVTYSAYPGIIYRMKEKSAVYEEWTGNNRERYFHDRILSNHNALSFTQNEAVRKYLKAKIQQYLKSLAASGSKSFSVLISYLLKHGYYQLPYKSVLAYFFRKTRQA